MNEIYKKAEELAQLFRASPEYEIFSIAKDNAMADETTKVLLNQYRNLQYRVQLEAASGIQNEENLLKLQKLGELLQLNQAASDYLFAQYRLNNLLTDVYSILAKSIDIDLSMLDN